MTKAERIAELAGQIEDDARVHAIKDILIDLRDCLKTADADEKAGMRAAIEIIEANYLGGA